MEFIGKTEMYRYDSVTEYEMHKQEMKNNGFVQEWVELESWDNVPAIVSLYTTDEVKG